MDVPAMAETAAKRPPRQPRTRIPRNVVPNEGERREIARRLCEEITSFPVFTQDYGPILTEWLFGQLAVQLEEKRPGSGVAMIIGIKTALERRGLMARSWDGYHRAKFPIPPRERTE